MLVLSRKAGEEIIIGDDIVITVVETGSGQIRLGVVAPSDVRIRRREPLKQHVVTDCPDTCQTQT